MHLAKSLIPGCCVVPENCMEDFGVVAEKWRHRSAANGIGHVETHIETRFVLATVSNQNS